MVSKWICICVLSFIVLGGCAHSQQIKVVTDIAPDGDVTYHTEYIAEF